MSYSSQIADLLAAQPTKLVTLHRHQLAGQAANLDFWLLEIRHSLAVIDGYRERFERMKAAQEAPPPPDFEYRQGVQLRHPEDRSKPQKLRPVDDKELRQSRLNLCEATYRFLTRCCNEGLISETAARASCESLGISVDSGDLTPHGK